MAVIDMDRAAPAAATGGRAFGWLGRLQREIVVRARARATATALAELGDRELADIGLRRDEIGAVAEALARRS
jgi:uncharacterized protein YjiS (DUF1127 family)